MDQQNQNPNPSDGDRSELVKGGTGLSRRALLRGGAAASPFLLTLASGPVAAPTNCVVASSFVSAGVFVSRGGTNNIQCVPKTAQNHCDEAKNNSWSSCNWDPHPKPVSTYCGTGVSCTSGSNVFTSSSYCYHVFKNSTSNYGSTGAGMQSSGDIAILQRLLALG